ncbi:uncharacterized protein LOC116187578 isoform X2 [Punica granatum]|uniref:Uncharacterized protein LOC116187578 isoform X2 n=1 Tax=Punica granatum TaxID=22663 RepID=A0A6P8BRX1_PUNGR|nr:uncharacterized protein LOC116187578 isoform X2 [Punica granatum]
MLSGGLLHGIRNIQTSQFRGPVDILIRNKVPELSQMQASPLLSSSTSNSRSFFFDFHTSSGEGSEPLIVIGMEPDPDEWEDEAEFTFACTGQPLSSPVPADKIFLNGQIRPSHPFKFPMRNDGPNSHQQKRPVREPLGRLFSQEREWNSSSWHSCSSLGSGSHSYEEDEFECLAPEMYCLWRAKAAREVKNVLDKKKKGDEPGGNMSVSKRWKIKDLVCNHGSKKVRDEP